MFIGHNAMSCVFSSAISNPKFLIFFEIFEGGGKINLWSATHIVNKRERAEGEKERER